MGSSHAQDLGKALGHSKTDKRIDILRRLQDAGSISEAARRAGVSYKAAWQAIDILSNLAGTPLVEKVVGGAGGGGPSYLGVARAPGLLGAACGPAQRGRLRRVGRAVPDEPG